MRGVACTLPLTLVVFCSSLRLHLKHFSIFTTYTTQSIFTWATVHLLLRFNPPQ